MDLARDSKGVWVGSFGQPDQGLRGLPLTNVGVEGQTVRFAVGGGANGTTFTGKVSDTSMTGDATSPAGTVPFRLTRTGDAVIEAPARSAPVSKWLEGRWNGTLAAGGQQLRLRLKITLEVPGGAGGSLSAAYVPHGSRGRGDGPGDVALGVRGREEPRLELRRRRVDTPGQHALEEAAIRHGVRL